MAVRDPGGEKQIFLLLLVDRTAVAKNLRDILVRAKHRRQAPPASGAFRCHRNRCKTCPFITEGTTSYTFFLTNKQRRTRHHITCSATNATVQYIGETKRHLSDRFGEHRRAIEKAMTQQHINQPTAVSNHFTLPSHSQYGQHRIYSFRTHHLK